MSAEGSETSEGKKDKSFQWSVELTALLLESLLHENGQTKFLLFPKAGSILQPLKTFTCYFHFCQRAFMGPPPEECTIEEYEKKLSEVLSSVKDLNEF